ncbi:MAG: nickel-dependent lactate racemase, partial [Oscillospiraceae bacterium]|nr:nickel-dependent lactate racemase [Oscillospiraceae bacterium]
MLFSLGYGKGKQELTVPDENLIGVLTPNKVEAPASEETEVRRALLEPIGSPRLRDIVKPGEKIAIVTSDITRPMPTYKVMPALLDELISAGVSPKDVTLVFALGSHRKHTAEEMRHLAGERAFEEINLADSDVNDCVRFGFTSNGTPVDITRTVAEADRRILLGNIEYHYFAGYSGGAKALMPGVSTPAAIEKNHSLMVMEESRAGNLELNPLRRDIEESGAMVGADFILNVVLN